MDNEIVSTLQVANFESNHSLLSAYQKQISSVHTLLEELDSSMGASGFGPFLEAAKKSATDFELQKQQLISKSKQICDILGNFDYQMDHPWAEELSKTGSQRGSVYDRILEGYLPLLKGCVYWDEQSMKEVPYLSIEVDAENGKFTGLGCTVLDPILGQEIPAVIGGRMLGPNSGDVVPINGVCKTAEFNVVVPFSNIDFKKPTVNSNVPALLEELLLAISLSGTHRFQVQGHESAPNQIGTSATQPWHRDSDSDARTAFTLSNADSVLPGDLLKTSEQQQSKGSQSQGENRDFILGAIVTVSSADLADSRETTDFVEGQDGCKTNLAPEKDDIVVAALVPTPEQPGLNSMAEIKMTFQEKLKAIVREFQVCHDNPDISQKIMHSFDTIHQKREAFKQNLEQRRDDFDEKHHAMVKKVQASSLGDEEAKAKLISDMQQQKNFMDEIVAQEHTRQMSMFERAQIEAAERRLLKMKKLLQQQDAEAAACLGNLTNAQRAAQRMEIEMDNALEDSISDELSNAAAQRIASISKEQQDVLEALAGTAGAPNGDELTEQLLARYETDVDEIETQIRQNLSESISQISTNMEIDFARKVARLRVTTEKARSKKNWGQIKMVVRVGALTFRRSKKPEELQRLAAERQEQQRVRLVAAIEAQEIAETNHLSECLGTLHHLKIAEAEDLFADKLKKVDDEKEREDLMKEHDSQMEELKKQLALDRQRQLDDLNEKIQNRRKLKVGHEQDVLHKEEISLLSSPKNAKDAESVCHKIESMLKLEEDRALLLQAFEQGGKLERDEIAREVESMAAAEFAEHAARMAKSLSATDDEDVRSELIRQHEFEMEALGRHMGLEKQRQLKEMQERLAQRRKKQLSLQEQLQLDAVKLLSSSETAAQAESLAVAVEAIARQEQQRVQLLSSLQELAAAEREEAVQEINLSINKATAEKEVELLAKLEAVDNDSERARLLKMHESEMASLKQQLQIDQQRQLCVLDQRRRERKLRKIDQTLGQMHEEQLNLISSPESAREAELIGLKLDVFLKQEVGAAQLNTAIVEQNSMEMRVLQENLASKQSAVVASANADFEVRLQGKDEDERDRLLAQHEVDLARIRAEGTISNAKAEDELHRLIQERKEKKRKRLEQQFVREIELLAGANDKESAVRAMEHVVLETSVEIEHEKKAAKLLFNIMCESQSEVKLLKQEMSEKSAQIIQNEEGRLAYDIAKLDLASSERQILLQVCLVHVCGEEG